MKLNLYGVVIQNKKKLKNYEGKNIKNKIFNKNVVL